MVDPRAPFDPSPHEPEPDHGGCFVLALLGVLMLAIWLVSTSCSTDKTVGPCDAVGAVHPCAIDTVRVRPIPPITASRTR